MADRLGKLLSQSLLEKADEKLKRIMELGAIPEQRMFGVGPKKKLSKEEVLEKQLVSDNELNLRSKGMKLRREGK